MTSTRPLLFDSHAHLVADDQVRYPRNPMQRAVDMFGCEQLMWGSDIGTSSGTYKDMVQRFLDAAVGLSPVELRALAHDTGKRVFVKGGVTA